VRLEGEDGALARITRRPVEADVSSFVVSNDALGADSTAFDVLCEVAQSGLATANMLELHVPRLLRRE